MKNKHRTFASQSKNTGVREEEEKKTANCKSFCISRKRKKENKEMRMLFHIYGKLFKIIYVLKVLPHKMVKHTQTICRQFVDELFECV